MNSKNIRRIIYVLVLLAIVLIRYMKPFDQPATNQEPDSVIEVLQSKRLEFTRHAECRMGCRLISEREIRDALKNGSINLYKSDLDDSPCPTYAIEDNTADGQTVRIIFANCDQSVKVVTAIDLKQDHLCDCK